MVDVSIIKGRDQHLKDCVEALFDSEIGKVYFSSQERAETFLREGLTKGELFVAVDEHGSCVGYIWFSLEGAFYKFPYVLNVAVRSDSRMRGVGERLLSFFEKEGFKNSSKLFLLVSDFNLGAKQFYEQRGYKEIGVIPDLIKEGISEHIMMKSKEKIG